ncbi:MAG: adenosylhomocysteinase [Bacteroidales bacterium]|nr:adenosylhomocysteinase [Bacteroidales bacterium]
MDKIKELIASTYNECEYPVCLSQAREWASSRPFEGLTILDATPAFRNTLVKHLALIAAGARLIVGRDAEGHLCDPRIINLLQESGIPIVSAAERQSEDVDVILDCAASFIHWEARLGAVELTRSGVPKYELKNKPLLVADSGQIKTIETSLGTGEGYFRAMAQLGYTDWNGRKVVIFGSGKVGTGLIIYAKKYGAEVTVITKPDSVTPQIEKMAARIVDCDNLPEVAAALKDSYAVVTATGVAGALSHPSVAKALYDSHAILANMGVEDEFGSIMPPERVLEGKKALNFILEEPTHLKYIDATMGLHNEGVAYLMNHRDIAAPVDPPLEIEEKLLNITRQRGCISEELRTVLSLTGK